MDHVGSLEAGERLIERLGERGVEYVFATFGTDHPTLSEFAEHAGFDPGRVTQTIDKLKHISWIYRMEYRAVCGS